MSDVVKPKRGGPRSTVDWSESQPYKRIAVSKVSPALGAVVSGVKLADVDDETYAEIRRALNENCVIFFRDQQMTPEQHIAFGRRFGDLDIHPAAANSAGFEEILKTGTCDVFGIDPGRAEGITGFKKAAERVEAYKRTANAHAWSSAIISAASLAVSFSSAAFRLFEFKPLANPMQNDLITEPFKHSEGWVYPPLGKPGLGIEVIDDVIDKYRQKF